MINNRLFKKINSIFWGLLTWLPIFVAILSVICFEFSPQIDVNNEISIDIYFSQFVYAITQVISNSSDYWLNPLTDVFHNISDLLDTIGSGQFYFALVDICAWVCWVQVMRLLVYVFYWFIDLISGLFDLMTFNRKGDN